MNSYWVVVWKHCTFNFITTDIVPLKNWKFMSCVECFKKKVYKPWLSEFS